MPGADDASECAINTKLDDGKWWQPDGVCVRAARGWKGFETEATYRNTQPPFKATANRSRYSSLGISVAPKDSRCGVLHCVSSNS